MDKFVTLDEQKRIIKWKLGQSNVCNQESLMLFVVFVGHILLCYTMKYFNKN